MLSRTRHILTHKCQASSASCTGSVPSITFDLSSDTSFANFASTGSDGRSDERNPVNFKGSRSAARNQHDFCIVSDHDSLGFPRQGGSMLFPRSNHPPPPERAAQLLPSVSPWRAMHGNQKHTPFAEPYASTTPIHSPLPVRAQNLKCLQSPVKTPVNRNHSPLLWQKRLPPGGPPVFLNMFQVDVQAPKKQRQASVAD